jgi:hypothetical protein
MPTLLPKQSCYSLVTFPISFDFSFPEPSVAFRKLSSVAVGVVVPETDANEYDFFDRATTRMSNSLVRHPLYRVPSQQLKHYAA